LKEIATVSSAHELFRRGRYAKALASIGRVVQSDPRSSSARLFLARLRLWRGEYSAARREAELVLAGSPECAEALRIRAATRVLDRRPEDALGDLKRALALKPQDAESLIWLAEAFWLLRFPGKALPIIDAALKLREEVVAAHLLRGLILIDLRDARSRDEWRWVDCKSKGALPHWRSMPAPKRASAMMRRLLGSLRGNRDAPATHVVRLDRGGARLQDLPPPADQNIRVRELSHLAQKKVREGNCAEALSDLESVLREQTTPTAQALACSFKGEVHLWLGDLEQAEDAFRQAIRINPQTRWAHVGLCGIHTLRMNAPLALKTANAIARYESCSAQTWRGEVLRRWGTLEEAAALLERTLGQYPSRIGTMLNLALAKGARGDQDSQRSLFEQSCALAPVLLADAAASCGVGSIGARTSFPDAKIQPILESALRLLRGNRSSWMDVYFAPPNGVRPFLRRE
jgi:tetratricopeptide (TPR) repeat protein